MANYYDQVLEGFESEGLFTDSYGNESFEGEGMFTEAPSDRRRPIRMPNSVGQRSDFGRRIPSGGGSSQGNFVTKSELRSSLDSISNQVNDLKKSSLSLAASIKRLDDGYEKVVKGMAKKQDNLTSSTTMMTLLGTLVNKPLLNTNALIVKEETPAKPGTPAGVDNNNNPIAAVPPTPATYSITAKDGQDPIQVDLTKTLLFTLMPMMMNSSSSSDNNMMMMLPMVLLLSPPAGTTSTTSTTSGTNNTNTLVLVMMMMMMMNNKK
jgi:hypothetical protein